jgi:hypothetical protein
MLHFERLRLKVGFGQFNLTAVVSLLSIPDFAKALLLDGSVVDANHGHHIRHTLPLPQ